MNEMPETRSSIELALEQIDNVEALIAQEFKGDTDQSVKFGSNPWSARFLTRVLGFVGNVGQKDALKTLGQDKSSEAEQKGLRIYEEVERLKKGHPDWRGEFPEEERIRLLAEFSNLRELISPTKS